MPQVVLTVSQIMWCCDLTECLTTTEGSVVEEVKQAEQRCFQVRIILLSHNVFLYLYTYIHVHVHGMCTYVSMCV